MKGFFQAGFIFLLIAIGLVALISLVNFNKYFTSKVGIKYISDSVYKDTLLIARLLSYNKQNIYQDAISDSVAIAIERSLNKNISKYTYVVVNLSVPNNISAINPILKLSDNFTVVCYYRSNISYVPKVINLKKLNSSLFLPIGKYKIRFLYSNTSKNNYILIYLDGNIIYQNSNLGKGVLETTFNIYSSGIHNISFKVSNLSLENIAIIYEDNYNLVKTNISEVICIGNDFLSGPALLCENNNSKKIIYNYWAYSNWTGSEFIGCNKSYILYDVSNFTKLTNGSENYTWYYLIRNKTLFKKFLIDNVFVVNGVFNNSSVKNITVYNFTYSGNFSINRSKSIEQPNTDYLNYELKYMIPSPGEYGGITGTGFSNLTCSVKNNFGSKINCETEPFIIGYSSDYDYFKPIQIPLKVCKELNNQNYNLILNTVFSYLNNILSEISFKLNDGNIYNIKKVFVSNKPYDCINITRNDGFNLSINICVDYEVKSSINPTISKEVTVCSPRQILFSFNKRKFGEKIGPEGKFAARIFYKKQENYTLMNITKYTDQNNAIYNCTVSCEDNITGIRYSGESIFYSQINVVDILRVGIDPDNGIFRKPFHILTTHYKQNQFISPCDTLYSLIESGLDCNELTQKLQQIYIYLNESDKNIVGKGKLINNVYFLNITVMDSLYKEFNSSINYGW